MMAANMSDAQVVRQEDVVVIGRIFSSARQRPAKFAARGYDAGPDGQTAKNKGVAGR